MTFQPQRKAKQNRFLQKSLKSKLHHTVERKSGFSRLKQRDEGGTGGGETAEGREGGRKERAGADAQRYNLSTVAQAVKVQLQYSAVVGRTSSLFELAVKVALTSLIVSVDEQ